MTEQHKQAIDVSGDGGVLKEIYAEGSGEVPPAGDEIRGAALRLEEINYVESCGLTADCGLAQRTTRARCWTAPSSTARATATRSSRWVASRQHGC